MAKKTNTGATTKVVALNAEEFQKLTPAEQIAHLTSLQETNAGLEEKLKEAIKEAKPDSLPTFEVDADDENDIDGGTYEFTCPTFTWDDNSIINVRELSAESESKDKKVAEKANAIIAGLVQRKSGIVRRKED